MSLSLDLKKIKSSGIYRFVYDKSTMPPAEADMLRLCIGYSNKGPFNTLVYVDNSADFETIYGKSSKKLEKNGIFFHRLCKEALKGGPILALNLKSFTNGDQLENINIDLTYNTLSGSISTSQKQVSEIYDTTRFWTLDPDQLPSKVSSNQANYFILSATDDKDSSCSVIIRPAVKDTVKGYDMTFREWFAESGDEIPDYIRDYMMDENVSDYFVEVYVFRGKFTTELCGETGVLGKYFDVSGNSIKLKEAISDPFGSMVDALYALANDSNSNYLAGYVGSTLPYFKDALGNYVSIDLLMNQDHSLHKMICKLNDSKMDAATSLSDIKGFCYPQDSNPDNEDEAIYSPIYIEGYTYSNSISITNSLGVLSGASGKGLREALTNHVDSEWRYLVDTYGWTGMITGADYKAQLSNLVRAKDNAFGIINFPPVSAFSDKSVGGSNGVVNTIHIPSDSDGASWIAYYTPYIVSDGAVKTIVPSAGVISNNFILKWSQRQPYNVVAGPIYGQIEASGLVGPDYNYSRADLDLLEPLGVNCLIYHPRFGTYINSNQTAKQKPVSALSKVHIRELVIYLQDEIEEMLRGYQWELNTATLRATIKAKADKLLENVKGNGGIYDYISICDESNNTPEIIDNELVILDVHIEPARAAGKMVQRLYIYRTGQIASMI